MSRKKERDQREKKLVLIVSEPNQRSCKKYKGNGGLKGFMNLRLS